MPPSTTAEAAAARPLLRYLGVAFGLAAAYFTLSFGASILFAIEGRAASPQHALRGIADALLTIRKYTSLGPAPLAGQVRSSAIAAGSGWTGDNPPRWRLVRDRASPKLATWSGKAIDGPLRREGPWEGQTGGCVDGVLPTSSAETAVSPQRPK